MAESNLLLGCIADDFTGASDAASFLVKGGMQTVLFNGVPGADEKPEGCQAVVIALKTRTQETESAVADTLEAAAWLKKHGAKQLYIKYCSTFDSTPKGNIGPVLDALLEKYQVPCTVLCPALPVNGRTVKDGKLYVNGVPLDESSMKDHPLTPMWDSRIEELMKPQSKYGCVKVSLEEMQAGIRKSEKPVTLEEKHWYIIPDYVKEEDAELITQLYGKLPILSGGSGLLTSLARQYTKDREKDTQVSDQTSGKGLLLAGSCSKATREQIEYYQLNGGKSVKIDPEKLMNGEQSFEELWNFIEDNSNSTVLLYSSDSPEAVRRIQQEGKDKIAGLLEQVTAKLAKKAVTAGYRRIIVAGGETSGAVTRELGFSSYIIGNSVAPGVPVMIPRKAPDIRLVLKSGNFGQKDFFVRALEMTGEKG